MAWRCRDFVGDVPVDDVLCLGLVVVDGHGSMCRSTGRASVPVPCTRTCRSRWNPETMSTIDLCNSIFVYELFIYLNARLVVIGI